MVTPIDLLLSIGRFQKKRRSKDTFYTLFDFCKTFDVHFLFFITLKVFKIQFFFFQELIDNNKSIGVTIYRCQIQAIIKNARYLEFSNCFISKSSQSKSSNKA